MLLWLKEKAVALSLKSTSFPLKLQVIREKKINKKMIASFRRSEQDGIYKLKAEKE